MRYRLLFKEVLRLSFNVPLLLNGCYDYRQVFMGQDRFTTTSALVCSPPLLLFKRLSNC
jgi:hypothetical protein